MFLKPAFPKEIERSIAEYAARQHFSTRVPLMLTAHRFKVWIEPLLYRYIMVRQTDQSMDTCPGRRDFLVTDVIGKLDAMSHVFKLGVEAIDFHGESGILSKDIVAILAACPRVTRVLLGQDADPDQLPVLAAMPNLTHLSVALEALFPLSIYPDFSQPTLHNVTHLEVTDVIDNDVDAGVSTAIRWQYIAQMLKLTHLAFCWRPSAIFVVEIVASAPALECIVIWMWGTNWQPENRYTIDPRVMFLGQSSCMSAPKSQFDWLITRQWDSADRFLAARRAGLIDASQWTMTEHELF
ncbi:hypothetical protein B0H19DRAFT_1261365 [Mycena capillaripes]|nr:hypothetical protein B0H19DRAFT_1261365 [Mycena capillaripes]